MITRDVPEPHENESFREFCIRCDGFLADQGIQLDQRLEAIAEAWTRRHPEATKHIGLDTLSGGKLGPR